MFSRIQVLAQITAITIVISACDASNGGDTKKKSIATDTVVKRSRTVKKAWKRTAEVPNMERKLDVSMLAEMLSWEPFETQKYLTAQGFDIKAAGKKIHYLLNEPDFAFPERIEDSLFFIKNEDGSFSNIKVLAQETYSYSSEQRSDVYRYSGDPRQYPDPFNAKNLNPSNRYHRVIFSTSDRTAILSLIGQLESLGCKFEKDIESDIVQEILEKTVPDHKRPKQVSNICSCPNNGGRIDGVAISFITNLQSDSPTYQLWFSASHD